jgi:hypothetical protein
MERAILEIIPPDCLDLFIIECMKPHKSPAEKFVELAPLQRREVHFRLCRQALERWDSYIRVQGKRSYLESVVGTLQEVDPRLPFDAFQAALLGSDTLKVGERYLEPLTALQDGDLVFPDKILYGYYAVYHLYRKYAQLDKVDDWLIVKQALASGETGRVWFELDQAVQKAGPALRD